MNSDADVGAKTINEEAFVVGGTLDVKLQVHLPNLVMKQIMAFSWTSKTTIMTFTKKQKVRGFNDVFDSDAFPFGDGCFLEVDHFVHRVAVPRYLVPIGVDYDAYLRSIGLDGWSPCATMRPLVKKQGWIVWSDACSYMVREWGYSFLDGMVTECQKLTQELIDRTDYSEYLESDEDE